MSGYFPPPGPLCGNGPQMPNPQQPNMDFGNNAEFRPLSTGAITKAGTDALLLGAKLFHPDELKKALEPPLMKLYT